MEIICKDIFSPIQDLRVQIHESTLVFPIQKTERRSFFLSNMDLFLNYPVSVLQFFSANPDFPPEIVVKKLKIAFQKVLVPYDFVAGRLRLNHQLGRLEIDCNAAGAGFVVASSEFSLDEISQLVYPNRGYKKLATLKLDNMIKNDQPLCIIQVTSFKCGGFSIAFSGNHLLYDGIGTRTFLENLASQAFEENRPLAIIPCHDRLFLAARSPPRVEFPHHELLKLDVENQSKGSIFEGKKGVLETRIFTLRPNHINYLKNRAKSNSGTKSKNTSAFNAVAALVWRCKTLSIDTENDDNKDRVSILLCAVEIRSRLDPPLPRSYCGNAVLNTYVSSRRIEIEKRPFPELVEMVSDGINRVTNEYVRSTLDWLEINKGEIIPNGDYLVSSWLTLGYEKVVYPWGKTICSCPVYYNKDICMLFSEVDGADRMNVVVSLPPKEMKRFQSLFLDFFVLPNLNNHSKL